MTDDLVTRLRLLSDVLVWFTLKHGKPEWVDLVTEAADRIEALKALSQQEKPK